MTLREEISLLPVYTADVAGGMISRDAVREIIDRHENNDVPKDEFTFANYICEAMDKWEAVNGSRRHDEARDAAASILEGIPARENPNAEAAPPHLGIDGKCPLCEKMSPEKARTMAEADVRIADRPALDALSHNQSAKADFVRAIVEAIDSHATAVSTAIWGRN